MKIVQHWDLFSFGLFIVMGILAACAIYYDEKRKVKILYIIWFITWTILASFRYVSNKIGGTDSLNYIHFFKECVRHNIWEKVDEHYEELFQIITKIIRYYTDDYRVYYLILYGFIVFSFILFIKEFHNKGYSCVPLVLSAVVYLKSYNTFRTSLAIAFILLGLVYLQKQKKIRAAILIILSFFIHRISAIYILFLPFYYFFNNKRLKVRYGLGLMLCSSFFIYILKMWLLTQGAWLLDIFDTGLLRNHLLNTPFSRAVMLIQMSCYIALIVVYKDLENDIYIYSNNKLHMLYMMIFYDFIMIPVYTTCGIWRAPEIFFIPRLVMWGYVISVLKKKVTSNSRILISLISVLIMIGVFGYYISTSWKSSGIMPYIYEPLITFYVN